MATPVPQLPLHKGFSPEGRAKHNEPLALWWQGPSSDPNISGRARVWLERSKVRRLLPRGVPDAGLALVELDPSMIPESICEVAIKGGDTLGARRRYRYRRGTQTRPRLAAVRQQRREGRRAGRLRRVQASGGRLAPRPRLARPRAPRRHHHRSRHSCSRCRRTGERTAGAGAS